MNAEFRVALEYEPPEGMPPEIAERAAEASRKIGLERPFRRNLQTLRAIGSTRSGNPRGQGIGSSPAPAGGGPVPP